MGAPSRREDPAVVAALEDELRGRGLEAALLILRRAGLLEADGRPAAGVAFMPDPGHAYPGEECRLQSQTRVDGEILAVLTPLFDLLGSMGVLPSHLSAWVQERVTEGDRAMLEFLALFHERLVQLFFQAHLRHRFWLRQTWGPARVDDHGIPLDPFQGALFGLLGLDSPEHRVLCGLPPGLLLHHAALLARRPCSARALEHVLSDYFETPVHIRLLLGGWVPLPAEATSPLGGASLGEAFALGDRVFDPADAFRIEFGPMQRELFQELLPGADGARVLANLVRFALGPGQRFDYVLALRAEDVPAPRLGAGKGGAALGQSLWTQAIDLDRVRWAGPFELEALQEEPSGELVA